VPADLKTVLFRILQEAMNNVAKHSGAGRVRLSLRKQEGALRLVVEDDGIGFDPSRGQCADPDLRGFGLTSMKERAELTEALSRSNRNPEREHGFKGYGRYGRRSETDRQQGGSFGGTIRNFLSLASIFGRKTSFIQRA